MRHLLLLVLLLPPAAAMAQADSTDRLYTTAVNQYRLRPGDVLRIRIWGQDQFSGEFHVDERGIIEYPLLGEIDTRDLTIGQLRERVRDGVGQLFREPFVTVTPLFRMSVLGYVNQPGLYSVDPTLTTFDVVALAGGTARGGSLNHIRLLRGGSRIQLDFEEEALAGRTLSEIGVRSGDQIIVGRPWLTTDDLVLLFSVLQVVLTSVILVKQF